MEFQTFLSATSVHKIKPSSFPRLLLTGTWQVIIIKENYDLRIAFGYAVYYYMLILKHAT